MSRVDERSRREFPSQLGDAATTWSCLRGERRGTLAAGVYEPSRNTSSSQPNLHWRRQRVLLYRAAGLTVNLPLAADSARLDRQKYAIQRRIAPTRSLRRYRRGQQGGLVQNLERDAETPSADEPSADFRAVGLVAGAAALALVHDCVDMGWFRTLRAHAAATARSADAPFLRAGTRAGAATAAGQRSRHRCRGRPFRIAGPVLGQRCGYHRAQERRGSRLARRALRRAAGPDWRGLARFARPMSSPPKSATAGARSATT